ncbi:MAG: hypothetical protein IJ086_00540 [Clostridium sp.]|nr:hypothetical protein [Clostridium sp.]
MLLNSELFNKKSAKSLIHTDKTCDGKISDYDKIELINKAILDRRLGATDTKVYTFLLNFKDQNYSQEEIAYELAITRMSVSKSISKLIAFNYISMEKQFADVSSYSIIEYKDAGICKTDIDNLVKMFNLDIKPNERFTTNSINPQLQIDNLKDNWNNFNNELKECGIDTTSHVVKSILSNDNYKLVLFIAKSKNETVKAFKEKYFESILRFYNKFANLWDEEFFLIYYKMLSNEINQMKSNKEYAIEDIMFYAGIPHASDKRVSNKFREDLLIKLSSFKDNYEELLSNMDKHEIDLPESIYNIARRIHYSDKNFSLEDMLVIAMLLNFTNKFEEKIGTLFHNLLENVDLDLYNDYILFINNKELFIKRC